MVNKNKIVAELHFDKSEKIKSKKEIVKISDLEKIIKKNNYSVILTKGAFDLVHAGHMRLFNFCNSLKLKNKNSILVVGVYSDKLVKILKGSKRPINHEEERAMLITGLDVVDYVVILDKKFPTDLIKKIKPLVYVKGMDTAKIESKKNSVVIEESEHNPEVGAINSYGGKIVIFCDNSKISSSELIRRISERYENDNLIQKAIKFSLKIHKDQKRYFSNTPYISHCFDVASILLKNGLSEKVVVAGLLHDVLEDGNLTPHEVDNLKNEFGKEVFDMIFKCSENNNISWKKRREKTINLMKSFHFEVQMLKCADNLANLRDFMYAYNKIGDKFFKNFEFTKEEKIDTSLRLLANFTKIKNTSLFKEYELELKNAIEKFNLN